MSAASVEASFKEQCDRLAGWRTALIASVANRTPLWPIVDNTQDQPYEDAVKGSSITALDNALGGGSLDGVITEWVNLHNRNYFPISGLPNVNSISTALAYYKWRVSERFAELYVAATGTALPENTVFPRAELVFGTIAQGGSFVAGTETTQHVGRVGAKVTAGIGISNWTLTATLRRADNTTVGIDVTIPDTATPASAPFIFGEESLTASAASGQADFVVASTANFKVGELVLLEEGTTQEVGVVSAINSSTVTLTVNLRNSYTTSAKAYPLFKAVTAVTQSGGSSGDAASIQIVPDRAVAI